jgi:hypothetical protein
VRLPRDHYVRLDSNDYSVHPSAVGRLVEVRADVQTVTVTVGGRLVARHERCWADHQTITDPQHAQAAADLRAQLSAQRRQPRAAEEQVEQRALTDYDAVFGLSTDLETAVA